MENLIAETREETVSEYQKSQNIRVLDVLVIGPVMIYAGAKSKDLPTWARSALILFGACTIYYNAKNYIINHKNNKDA
jgi:hypothetical protein